MKQIRATIKDRLSPKTRQSLRRFINWPIIIDVAPLRETVFLAGTGRSGSGWVANIINSKNDRRYMYEPFNPHRTETCAWFTFGRYVRPDTTAKELVEPIQAVLEGRLGYSDWVDQANKRFVARKRLIKETRAHLWLNWVHARFPEVKIVLLFRHPCAVANSRVKRGNVDHLSTLLDQPDLMHDHLAPFRDEIERARSASPFERNLVVWCIQHRVPLRQFKPGEMHLTFYENYVHKPEEELARLFAYLGEPPDDRAIAALKRPSHVTRPDAAILTGRDPTANWKDEVGAAQVARAFEILRTFGLEGIYGDGLLPDVAAANALLARD